MFTVFFIEQGELYPAKVCKAAPENIKNCTIRFDKIISRRAEGVQYIGDLFPEIKPD